MIPSQKTAADRFDLKSNDATKVYTRVDALVTGACRQFSCEATRGYSFGVNEGSADGINDLSVMTATNYSNYKEEEMQIIQTCVANKNLLEVDAISTANAITLIQRTIDSDTTVSGINEAKAVPFQFRFRDGLEKDFVATLSNTGAVTISIPNLQGFSGALNLVKQDGSALITGDIVAGYRYTIIDDHTNNRVILKDSFVRNATTSARGVSYQHKQIALSYGSATTMANTAGTFEFDDGTGQATLAAGTTNLTTTGVNGLDTGSLSANLPYYIFGIYNPTTGVSARLASLSKTSPTLPSGYTKKSYLGAFMTNASSQIRQGDYIYGNRCYTFYYTSRVAEVGVNAPAVGTTLYPISVPLSDKLEAITVGMVNTGVFVGDVISVNFGSESETFLTTIPDQVDMYAVGDAARVAKYDKTFKTATKQVKVNVLASTGARNVLIYTRGWKESL